MSIVLGENIRTARKEAGLRQDQLAELIGVTQAAISQFEKGKNPPSSETFQAIRKELRPFLGESRLNFYLPKHLADSDTQTINAGLKSAGADIRVLGRVAAGKPIQPFEKEEPLTIPIQMLARGRQTFALQVQGHSMIGLGIFHGDIVILHENPEPLNGQIIVAQINEYEYTLKTWYRDGKTIKLLPSNPDFDEITLTLGEDKVRSIGEYAGLIRLAK